MKSIKKYCVTLLLILLSMNKSRRIFSKALLSLPIIFCVLISAPTPVAGKSANVESFYTYKYIDPMTNMEVFRMLIPKSWTVKGGVTWSSNPALPAQSGFKFYNPNGSEELNFFPTRSFFWTDNQMFLTTNPPGTLRFGTPVARPVDLHTAFTRVVIPYSKGNPAGLKIGKEKNVPELAKIARGEKAQGVKSSAEAGKMRIYYNEKGKQIEEEIYAAVSQFVTNLPATGSGRGYYINYWFVDDVFSFKAEKGKLDSYSKTFQTMIYSMKLNPHWFAKFANVKEMLAQAYIRGMKAIGNMGQMVARAGSDMREDQAHNISKNEGPKKAVGDFSDQILEIDRYYDARDDKEVELPAGYGHAWSNNLGEYKVSESSSFNPNEGSNLHWEELERR